MMKKRFTAIILLNILAGLLFSCGEGVRLLPFPNSEIAGKSQSQLHRKNKIPYQPNVLRFDNGKAKYQTKTQRENQPNFTFGNAEDSEKIFLSVAAKSNDKVNLSGENRFKSLIFLSSKSSRAPPFFS